MERVVNDPGNHSVRARNSFRQPDIDDPNGIPYSRRKFLTNEKEGEKMENLCADIRTFLVERGWDSIRPSDIAKSISIEAAELLELFQWNDMTLEELRADPERMARLPKEVADILIYALYLPILLGLDAETIIREKLAQNAAKYPAKLMRERADKSGTSSDPYIQIKRRHRREENA